MLDGIRANAQSWGVKLAFGIIIIVFVFWGIGSYTAPKGIIATVNDEKITELEFRRTYGQMEQNIRNSLPDITPELLQSLMLEQQVLQTLVVQKLVEAEAKRLGVSISPWELRRMMESLPYFLDKDGKFDPAIYVKTFEGTGRTVAQFEADMSKDMLPQKMQTLMSAGAWANPVVTRHLFDFQQEKRTMDYVMFPAAAHMDASAPTAEEVDAAYKARADLYALPPRVRVEYVELNPALMANTSAITDDAVAAAYAERTTQFTEQEKVRARHILRTVSEKASAADVKKAEDEIKAIEARIKAGEDFGLVAMEAGQDGTAAQGGDLGWFSREQMVPTFADAAFALKAGEISTPVRSPFGFHLIKVEERQEAKVRPLDEVKDELKALLATEEASKGLLEKSDTVLAAALGGKDLASAAAGAGLTADVADSGLLSAEELASKLGLRPSDMQIIMATPAGSVVDTALATANGMLVVRVAESNPQMVRPLDEVREDLIGSLTRDKARKMALAEAQNARSTFKDGSPITPDLASRVQRSEPFGRGGTIPQLGYDPALVKAVFAVPVTENNWLGTAYVVDDGAVFVRPAEIIKPSEQEWADISTLLEENRLTSRGSAIYQMYLMMLNKNADVRILEPSLFQRKPAATAAL